MVGTELISHRCGYTVIPFICLEEKLWNPISIHLHVYILMYLHLSSHICIYLHLSSFVFIYVYLFCLPLFMCLHCSSNCSITIKQLFLISLKLDHIRCWLFHQLGVQWLWATPYYRPTVLPDSDKSSNPSLTFICGMHQLPNGSLIRNFPLFQVGQIL